MKMHFELFYRYDFCFCFGNKINNAAHTHIPKEERIKTKKRENVKKSTHTHTHKAMI